MGDDRLYFFPYIQTKTVRDRSKYPGINYGTLAGYDGHEKEKSQIDYSEYLPKKSMIKRYTNRSSSNSYRVKIIRDGDQLTYMHNRIGTSKNSIAYDVVLKIDKEYIFESFSGIIPRPSGRNHMI
jgi:hypothetical protein